MCNYDPDSSPSPSGCRPKTPTSGVSRRGFLGGLGGAAALGALSLQVLGQKACAGPAGGPVPGDGKFPTGKPLRVKPVLMYSVPTPREKTSWRGYGGVQTHDAAKQEAARIDKELRALQAKAEFPIELLPVALADTHEKVQQAAASDADAFLLYAAGGGTNWPLAFNNTQSPMVMFVRHQSGPFYLWYEIAHWRFLRQNGDRFALDKFDVDDVVVDGYDEMLWRLRALYGLHNAKGTTMLTIGGMAAYSGPAQENGPRVAKEVWGYRFVNVTDDEFAKRLAAARADEQVIKQAERQTDALLQTPNVKLATERRFVVNSFLALHVCRQLLEENGASNFGFARCMGHGQIAMLDTPPCLVLSLANDAGYTAYCHTDLSHTMPGVLLRWIAGRPAFVCNSHYPHDGLFTVAHCAAPRRMNGRDFEPATIMTHFESDYGAACKTHYTKGQVVTVVIPNLGCTRWQGFRGTIVGSPSFPACRSQMEIRVDGDWRRLLGEMEGFHTQIVYGDYTREIGYALKKLGGQIAWQCYSEPA